MAFIISKNSKRDGNRRKLYYLVENYRDNGKIKRKTILHLNECNSIDMALDRIRMDMDSLNKKIHETEVNINAIKEGRPYVSILSRPHYRQLWIYIDWLKKRKESIAVLQKKKNELLEFKNRYQNCSATKFI